MASNPLELTGALKLLVGGLSHLSQTPLQTYPFLWRRLLALSLLDYCQLVIRPSSSYHNMQPPAVGSFGGRKNAEQLWLPVDVLGMLGVVT